MLARASSSHHASSSGTDAAAAFLCRALMTETSVRLCLGPLAVHSRLVAANEALHQARPHWYAFAPLQNQGRLAEPRHAEVVVTAACCCCCCCCCCLPLQRIVCACVVAPPAASCGFVAYPLSVPTRSCVPHCSCLALLPEFSKIAQATSIGFAIMGFIGFFVKLIFIPINNIIVAGA